MARRLLHHFGYCDFEDLRFLTVLCAVSYDPRSELPHRRDRLKRKLDKAFARLSTTPRVYGAYEIDVKRPSLVTNKQSRDVLKHLDMEFVGNDTNAYLLHLHAVVDLNGGDAEQLKKALKKEFKAAYQVKATHFRSDDTVTTNLTNISNYITKTRLQYSDNIIGNGAYRKATYGSFYPDDVIRDLAVTLQNLHGQNHYAKFSHNI
jgi:hypothetical protein